MADRPAGARAFEAAIAQELPYNGAILLLDPCLIIFSIGSRTREFDSMAQAILDESVIHELGTVVHIQRT